MENFTGSNNSNLDNGFYVQLTAKVIYEREKLRMKAKPGIYIRSDMEQIKEPPKLIEYEGYLLPRFRPLVADVKKHMQGIQDFESRDTDVLLCTFPKSGTHWVTEILTMLLAGSADYETGNKAHFMEYDTPEAIDKRTSPRLLRTHLPLRHIPMKHVQNGYKIVHVLRNPKDCAVSWYTHSKRAKGLRTDEFPGTWEQYITGHCENKLNVYTGWWNYEKEWEQAKRENTVTNVHTMFYEDLRRNPVTEIKKMANFLGCPYTDELLMEIAEKCSFKNLLQAVDQRGELDVIKRASVDGINFIFRKGEIGDWKNWFTVAQNEMFDAAMEREMKDSTLKFTYQN